MPFSIRPYRRFLVQHTELSDAGPLLIDSDSGSEIMQMEAIGYITHEVESPR